MKRKQKPYWESKTFWLNVLSAAGALILLGSEQSLFGIDPKTYIVALAGTNIALRFVTDTPIGGKK